MTERTPEQPERPACTTPLPSEPVPLGATVPLPSSFSQSRIVGSGPLTGSLRVADLQDKMLGEFRLLRRLGGGGMAEVWLAEQTSLHRQVAVKVMRPDIQADEMCRKRFEQEAHAAAGLNHPNIVQVYAIGEAEGIRFIAQEYVQGLNMRDYIAKKGPPPVQIAMHIMKQVAAAVQAASEAGIVHRDIKPENILLTRKGLAKVADFGLAQLTQPGDNVRLTQIGVTMGTPLYMSPEQVQGKKVDHRSDIYSLGVTFYHLLCGRPPFRGETAMAVAIQQVQSAAPPLIETRSDLPSSICNLVHRMMAKKPDDRFQSAQAVLQELRKIDKDGLHELDFANAGELPAMARIDRSQWVRGRGLIQWLHPRVHPWGAFVIWGVLVAAASVALGARSRPGPALRQRVARQSHTEKQPTIAGQVEVARRQDTEDAWRAVLVHFPGDAPEKHEARAELILRLLPQLRLREVQEICENVTRSGNAPPSAAAVAWAGRAIIYGLEGNMPEAQLLVSQHVRSQEQSLPPELREWVREMVDPRRRPPGSPRGMQGGFTTGADRGPPRFSSQDRTPNRPTGENGAPRR